MQIENNNAQRKRIFRLYRIFSLWCFNLPNQLFVQIVHVNKVTKGVISEFAIFIDLAVQVLNYIYIYFLNPIGGTREPSR